MFIVTMVWIIVALSFLILELILPGLFFFISFSCSAFCVALASYFISSFFAQGFLFLILTLLHIILLRYLINRSSRSLVQTNSYALIGKKGVVTYPVSLLTPGYVKIGGQEWLARSLKDTPLRVGTVIEVKDVRGAHLVVETSVYL